MRHDRNQHHAAGNMAGGPRPGAEDTRLWLRYDAWNRLTHVSANSDHNPTIATYRYDGLHRRISKAITGGDTFHYYYNENWQVLEVTKGSAAYEQYVWDARYIDAPVLRDRDTNSDAEDGFEERLYYLTDANMNVTAMVDVSGNVVERYRYDAYGKVTFLAGAKDLAGNPTAEWTVRNASIADNQVLYCGYRFDPETGLYQVRHRMLHPTAGRWMQRDPAGYVDGLGLYEYVGGQPVAMVDPMGLVGAGFHHWYPLYLGGALVQPGMRWLDAALHTAVHSYFTRLGYGGPGCRWYVQIAAKIRWQALGVQGQRALIAGSMRLAGLTEKEIAELLPGVMRGARPGIATPRMVGGTAFGAATIILTGPSVAYAAEYDPTRDLWYDIQYGRDADGDSILDHVDPEPMNASAVPNWILATLEVQFISRLPGIMEDKYVYRDTWLGFGSGEWVYAGRGPNWRRLSELKDEYLARVRLWEQLVKAFR